MCACTAPTPSSSLWNPQPPVCRTWPSRSGNGCIVWWRSTCRNLGVGTRGEGSREGKCTVFYVRPFAIQTTTVGFSSRLLRGGVGWRLLPCRAPLSRKLFRLNRVFLEARYWIKRCKKRDKKHLDLCLHFDEVVVWFREAEKVWLLVNDLPQQLKQRGNWWCLQVSVLPRYHTHLKPCEKDDWRDKTDPLKHSLIACAHQLQDYEERHDSLLTRS